MLIIRNSLISCKQTNNYSMFVWVFLLCGFLASCCGNPNLKLVVTKEGIEVVGNKMLDLLSVEASHLKMEDFRGSAKAGGGTVDYYVENLQVLELPKPQFNVTITPGVGLTLHLSDATVRLTTGWGVAYEKGILRIRNNGTGEIIINGTGVDLELSLGVDKNGRLLLAAKSCVPRVGSILYRLDDEALFYDFVIQVMKKKIRTAIEKGICQAAMEGINKDLEKLISDTSFKTNLGSDMEMDFGLTSAPVLAGDYIEVPIASKFMDDPLTDSDVDMKVSRDHMISLFVSQELFNSASRALYEKKRLQFVQKSPTILSFLGSLNISTASTGPDAHFSFVISSTIPPLISISPDNITLTTEISGNIALILNENFTYNVLRLSMAIQCQLKLSVKDGQLVGTLGDIVALSSDSSSIPEEGKDLIRESMISSTRAIVDSINSYTGKGLPLVCRECTTFTDTDVSLHEGYLVVATNLKITN